MMSGFVELHVLLPTSTGASSHPEGLFLGGFAAVPFLVAVFAGVPELNNKPTCVQRSFHDWAKSLTR